MKDKDILNKIKIRFTKSINLAKELDELNEPADWRYEQGILISYKEALLIIQLIEDNEWTNNKMV